MLKLYIYESGKGIRSSRKWEENCGINLEAKWMVGGVKPDFRKDNFDGMKKVFHEFNRRISEVLEGEFCSLDGS